MPQDIRWIRSYVVKEEDGKLGTVCIYEASSPEKIREHAQRVGMPATRSCRCGHRDRPPRPGRGDGVGMPGKTGWADAPTSDSPLRATWAILDSNQGPPPYQSGALTN